MARRAEILRKDEDFKQQYEQQNQALMAADERAGKEYDYYVRVHQTEPEKFTDQLRSGIDQRYREALRDQNRCQSPRLETLKLRNANRPLPDFEKELIQQIRDIIHTLQERAALLVRERKAATPERSVLDAWAEQMESEDLPVRQQANNASVGYLSKIADLNQQLIDLSTQELNFVEELRKIPGFVGGNWLAGRNHATTSVAAGLEGASSLRVAGLAVQACTRGGGIL